MNTLKNNNFLNQNIITKLTINYIYILIIHLMQFYATFLKYKYFKPGMSNKHMYTLR